MKLLSDASFSGHGLQSEPAKQQKPLKRDVAVILQSEDTVASLAEFDAGTLKKNTTESSLALLSD